MACSTRRAAASSVPSSTSPNPSRATNCWTRSGSTSRPSNNAQAVCCIKHGETMANILIIDDSPTDVKIFSGALERAGHKVTSVASAEAGIDAAHKTKPDLVLMDVIMPGMNGFQATRSLTKDVLVKPVSEKDLVAHVNKHLPAGG